MRILTALLASFLVVSPAFAAGTEKKPAKAKPAAKQAAPAAQAKAKPAAAPAASKEQLTTSFHEFCESWKNKLAEREARNLTLIEWDKGQNWVQGTYTGFAPDHTCLVDDTNPSMAIGKMTYREVKWEKRGTTIEDAQERPSHPIETTEVTEIFRYEKGQWVY